MDRETLLGAARAVRWNAIGGAYGQSSLVLPAFERLIDPAPDVDSDDWNDAFDVFQSHVWHQGTVYAVTSAAVPLLVDLCRFHFERSSAGAAPLGELLATYATSASEAAPPSRTTIDVLAAFLARADDILGWMAGSALDRHAIAIAFTLPELEARLDADLERRATLPTYVYLALSRRPSVPAWATERAARDVVARGDAGAAALLLRHGRVAGAILDAVERALPPDVAGPLGIRLADFVDVTSGFDGPITEGTVLFAGPSMVSVKVPGRALTLKWPSSGLTKGASVGIGLSPNGEPRVVETREPDGGIRRRAIRASGVVG